MSAKPSQQHYSPYVFDDARRKIVQDFKYTANDLRARLEFCGFPKWFIEKHIDYYHEFHGTPRPSVTIIETTSSYAANPHLKTNPWESDYPGSSPYESSKDGYEDSKDESMPAFGASMSRGAERAGHAHLLVKEHLYGGAEYHPPAYGAAACSKNSRKSCFEPTAVAAASAFDETILHRTCLAEEAKEEAERPLGGESKGVEMCDGT